MSAGSKINPSSLDVKHLDKIIKKMIANVNDTKTQIFEIGEQSRKEYDTLIGELKQVKQELSEVIDRSDQLEIEARKSRGRLAEISRAFDRYGEQDIRDAYLRANTIQNDLSLIRQRETQMKARRTELERRIVQLRATMDKAERLIGQVTVVLNYLTSDLKQVGEAVASAREQRALGLKIIEALEEERKRLSREIHDGPAQTLAQVLVGMEIVDRVAKKEGEKAAREELRKYRGMVQNALAEVRRIIYDLRPMSLDDLGLIPTLQKYFHRLSQDFPDLSINFQSVGEEKRLQSKIESALFRMLQEAVQNVCLHAKAKYVTIRLEYRKERVLILVRDDGVGFNQDEPKENRYGLIGMKERAELLNGDLVIRSEPNQGTSILINIPFQKEDEWIY
ncbi:sensor histidine kinase [Sporolactobacillus spathodeae]|uniref:Signal transduction histidine-protein kinase/phosphatase DegS n=1 Tax=Sporolactobacillus spathodeae TaxID=1465502 RepID=A0ABS2Q6B3_9BACL|nr:sensor histidine kinase [Sporolactobacillus spathodeae]MBM7657268.1 two-component system sensor histidine kinase DegS [Sporolactobacillus spathodeae]